MNEAACFLSLADRKKLIVDGVIEILRFDSELIVMYTTAGDLRIRGRNLEIENAFSDSSKVVVNGFVKSLLFGDNKEKIADNIISRLFR